MTEEQILEGNKLIAEFMMAVAMPPNGQLHFKETHIFKPKGRSNLCHEAMVCMPEDLEYHSSWDWLIPVIDKITSMDEYIAYKNHTSNIVNDGGIYINTKYIINTWKEVIEFIIYYNLK